MYLKLVLPEFSKEVRSGTIARWHVVEGARVDFGADLFDLRVTERFKMARPGAANSVIHMGSSEPKLVRRTTDVLFRVVSADVGTLVSVLSPLGGSVDMGDIVGVVSTDPEADGPLSTPVADLPSVRVAVNLLEGLERADG